MNAPVANFGENADTSSQILSRFLAAGQFANSTLIWSGRNDFASASPPYTGVCSTVEGNIATMVGDLTGHAPYRVLSIINGNALGEQSGGALYDAITSCNSSLATTYGSNFIDVRSALVAAYNPSNAVDVANHSVDIPPTSCEAQVATASVDSGSPIASGDTTITIASLSFVNGAGTLMNSIATIDNENLAVVSVAGSMVTVTRGVGGTSAAAHSAGSPINFTNYLHLNSTCYGVVAQAVAANF